LNEWGLSGNWTVNNEHALLDMSDASKATAPSVAAPSSNEEKTEAYRSLVLARHNLELIFATGSIKRAVTLGNSTPIQTALAAPWLAATAQPPATAARVATVAKVTAMPTSVGNPLRAKGRGRPARTRMAGLVGCRAGDREDAAEIGEHEQQHVGLRT
jgi:hypothetical protein